MIFRQIAALFDSSISRSLSNRLEQEKSTKEGLVVRTQDRCPLGTPESGPGKELLSPTLSGP